MGTVVTTPLSVAQADKFPIVPIANGIVPEEALAITCTLQFSPTVQAILIDLSESARKFNDIPIQGAFIDTSGSAIDLRVDNSVTGQSVLAKAGLQGYYNLLCPMPAKLIAVLASAPAGQLNITMILYNTVIESEVWGLTSGPAGPTGPQGPPGPTGATGPQGPAGPAGVIQSVQNQGTLVTPARAILNFTGTGVTATDDAANTRTNITIPGAPVASVFTRTGAVTAQIGDYTAAQVTNAVSTLGAYSDPSWITALSWPKITGAPSISSYQTPWLTNINAANNNLLGAGLVQSIQSQLMGTSTQPAQQAYYFNSLLRWTWTQVNTETGSNVGSDLTLVDYNDAGTSLGTVLFFKRSTSNMGVGTANPLYKLDVRTPGSLASQVHVASTDTDAGAYLVSAGDSNCVLAAGCEFNGTNWIAKATTATQVTQFNGGITFLANIGLTVGSSYTPAAMMNVSTLGVGVGSYTTSTLPSYPLDIRTPGSVATQVHIASTNTDAGGYITSIGGNDCMISGGAALTPGGTWMAKSTFASILQQDNGNFYFYTDGGLTVGTTYSPTQRVAITNNGNVGIGVNPPVHLLQLVTDDAAKPGTNTWTIASGSKVKRHIKKLKGGLEIINKLNPTESEYNGKGGTPEGQRVVSLIAEEVREILPHTVTEDANGNLGFNVHEVIHHLILAVQQLSQQLANMKPKAV